MFSVFYHSHYASYESLWARFYLKEERMAMSVKRSARNNKDSVRKAKNRALERDSTRTSKKRASETQEEAEHPGHFVPSPSPSRERSVIAHVLPKREPRKHKRKPSTLHTLFLALALAEKEA